MISNPAKPVTQKPFSTIVRESILEFTQQFANWVFDERDSGDELETIVLRRLGRGMTPNEIKQFKPTKLSANIVFEDVCSIGHNARVNQLEPEQFNALIDDFQMGLEALTKSLP